MRRIRFLVVLTVLVGCGFAGAMAGSRNNDLRISAGLRALSEVPPNTSKARGDFRGTISDDGTTLTYTLRWSGLTTLPLFSHIHFAPTKVNGGIMVFLCNSAPPPATVPPAGTPACPQSTTGEVTGTVTAASITGPAVQGLDPAGDFADVVRAILTGNAYANLHTTKYPGGELRGQVDTNHDRWDNDDDRGWNR